MKSQHSFGSNGFACAALAAIGFTFAAPASGSVITDPANDFIPTFTGTRSPDLDALSAFATFDGTNIRFGATVNGPIGTLPTALYVIGFNRGAGVANFGAIGLPNIIFDSVITMDGTGVTGGFDLVAGTPITLPAGAAHISGNSFTIDIPASLLPGTAPGFTPLQYGVNIWPRDSSVGVGLNDAQIADFAPNDSDFLVSAPEPLSAAILASGLIGLALVRRRSSG